MATSFQRVLERSQVTIRRASLADLVQIVTIWRDGLVSQGEVISDLNQAMSIFRERVESETGPYGTWVAEIEGAVVGWQSLHPCKANPFHKWAESSTYISNGSKGSGIGRKLLTFATEHAKSVGLTYVVGVIIAGNEAPIKIVESLGWHRVGIIPRAKPADTEYLYYVYPVPHD